MLFLHLAHLGFLVQKLMCLGLPFRFCIHFYRQTSSIRCIKSQNFNVSRFVLQWSSLPIPWSQVLSREWRCSWSTLSDQQFYCPQCEHSFTLILQHMYLWCYTDTVMWCLLLHVTKSKPVVRISLWKSMYLTSTHLHVNWNIACSFPTIIML